MSVISGPAGPCSPHPELARLLVTSVWMLRSRTRRRIFTSSAAVHLLTRDGEPTDESSGDLLAEAANASLDHALRVDLAVRSLGNLVLARQPPGAAVRESPTARARATMIVVRPGPLESLEQDRAWWRSWLVASDIVGVEPAPVYAVTRLGWLDVIGTEPVVVPRLRGSASSRGVRQPGR
jgi:hypothetical protein